MRRFFISQEMIFGDQVILHGSEARHIITVLRLQVGHEIELFDGEGLLIKGRIEKLMGDDVHLKIVQKKKRDESEIPKMILGIGMLKGRKMDMVLQKATELGVHAITPLITSFCEKRRSRVRQIERWNRIILEACKQSKRSNLMLLNPVISLSEFIQHPYDVRIVCYERDGGTYLDDVVPDNPESVALLVGPEGGFSDLEIREARLAGFKSISLHSNILRAETAALAAISITGFLLEKKKK